MIDETHAPRRGMLFILSSPSGAGKSTLSRRLLATDPEIALSVSATTRAPRPGEEDGVHYHFVTPDRFQEMAAAGEMLEHAEVFGNFYGTPKAPVEREIEAGRDVIFDIDWQGGRQLRASALGDAVVSVFILPPSIKELGRRLRARGQDAPEVIAKRMEKNRDEIAHWDEYDYILINDDLDRCEAQIRAILRAERLRRFRRPGLSPFAAALEAEFEEGWE